MSGEAISPTPNNFSAGIAANSAAASTPASTPASAPASSTPASAPSSLPHPGQTPAAVPAASPANTNAAQPPAPANTNAETPAAAPADAGAAQVVEQAPAVDPWGEEIHGVTVRELVDAAKNGSLPESALQAIKVTVKVNGQELQVPLREAANGYQRVSDYTRGMQQIAAERAAFEQGKANIAKLFAGWNQSPEAFAQSMERMGLTSNVRGMVTKNWGTAEKPNVDAFMEDMRRLGHFQTFRAAANAYAADYARRMAQYNPLGDQYMQQIQATKDPAVRARLMQEAQMLEQRAMEMFQQYEREADSMWSQRVAAETEAERLRREAAMREQAQLLAPQQQPQQQPLDPRAVAAHVSKIRDDNFSRLGIKLETPQQRVAAMKYFQENMESYIFLAEQDGGQEPIESIIQKAAEETARSLQLYRPAGAPAAAPVAVAPAKPAPAGLPPTPVAAPATTPTAIAAGRTAADFEKLAYNGWKLP